MTPTAFPLRSFWCLHILPLEGAKHHIDGLAWPELCEGEGEKKKHNTTKTLDYILPPQYPSSI